MTPLFSHPTTVILFDDDMSYLRNLSLTLPEQNFTYKLCQSAEETLSIINKAPIDFESGDFIRENEMEHTNSSAFEYDIPSVHNLSQNDQRFEKISTLIVDYDMPEMNGVEFLKKIQNKNIRKILLTGQASEEIAINAFNQGVIHRYIKKNSIEKQLNEAIIESQKDYFKSLSEYFLNTLIEKFGADSALKDPVFEAYFNGICESYNIIETYLLDPIGSYLMLDDKGRAFILHTQNTDLVDSYFFDIEGQDQEVFSNAEIQDIRDKKKIFCYRSFKKEKLPDPSKWGPFFKEAVHIGGKNSFYCSFQALEPSLLSPETLVAFSPYLNT